MKQLTLNSSLEIGRTNAGEAVLSLGLGLAFTLSLFWGIAHFQDTSPVVAPLEFDELRTIALPLEPPPPRVVPPEAEPAAATVTGFDAAPSESPVKITIPPPELAELLPPPTAPAAVIQVGELYTSFRPKMDIAGYDQRIFQTSEVDQIPRIIRTVTPEVPSRMLKDGVAHVTFILVISPNGSVTTATLAQSSGNPELDEILSDNIKEWTFSPAAKRGKRVRCLIQQGFYIKLPSASRFTL